MVAPPFLMGFDILIFIDHLGHIDLVQSPPGHQQQFVGGAGERKKKESNSLNCANPRFWFGITLDDCGNRVSFRFE